MKLKEMGIEVPKSLQIRDKPVGEDNGENEKTSIQQAKLLHYDKEDLISFHNLFINKCLTKACSELEYDHPTVIQRQVIPAIIEG